MQSILSRARLVSAASRITSRVRSVRPPRIQSRRPGPATLLAMTRPVARLAREPAAEDRLGASLRHRIRRHRIHLGGVDEVDALRDARSRAARAPRLRCSARPTSSCRGTPRRLRGRCRGACGISSASSIGLHAARAGPRPAGRSGRRLEWKRGRAPALAPAPMLRGVRARARVAARAPRPGFRRASARVAPGRCAAGRDRRRARRAPTPCRAADRTRRPAGGGTGPCA